MSPQTMEATAILLSWRQIVALSKVHDLCHQLGCSATDWAVNNVIEMAAPLAPFNLRQDSIASAGAKRTTYVILSNLMALS